MTISKERLNEIALDVAQNLGWPTAGHHGKQVINFALALIRRVEAESITVDVHNNQVIYVPLVSEE